MEQLAAVTDALDRLREGGMVIVVDDEDRENEGDIVMAAEHVTQESMAFVIRHTGGVVCLSLAPQIADALELPPMAPRNTSRMGTPFTVSIEAAEGVTTGISAADRARTVLAAINPVAAPADLRRPGHVFPLRASEGGVLVRAGHTEASVDLCRLAGLREGAIISELMHDDGSMMRLPDLLKFGKTHGLPVISIADLIAHRRKHETFVREVAATPLETETGEWIMHVFEDRLHGHEHVALTRGEIRPDSATLVRVHSQCLTGDTFGSRHCDCGQQLQAAMRAIAEQESGVILYLRQEGRGIGLANKTRAYALQRAEGLDTVEANERLGFDADLREYGIGAQILRELKVGKMKLMTNNPRKIVGLEGYGLEMVERVPLQIEPTHDRQRAYLDVKKTKLGHLL